MSTFSIPWKPPANSSVKDPFAMNNDMALEALTEDGAVCAMESPNAT